MPKNLYELLEITKKAEEKEIKSAYRRLARKYHPDVNPNDKASEAKFKEISQAYDVLGDSEKRKLYDQYGDQWEQAKQMKDQGLDPDHMGGVRLGDSGGYDPNGGFGNGGFETIFGQFFNQGGRGGNMDYDFADYEIAQPRDVEKAIEVSLEDVDSGTKRILTYQTMDAQRTREGMATVPTTKKVEITIPAGIPDGKKLRVPGKGAAGANGKAGDLFVAVKWASHDKFRKVNEALEVDVDVPYTTAALGGQIRVPTLRSHVSMKIPEGTQSGQTFRLKGQGITKLGGQRGDLMARVRITVPKTPTGRERELLSELAGLSEVKA